MIRSFPGMCDAKPLPRLGGEIELSDESAAGLLRIGVAELAAENDGQEDEPADSTPAPKRGPGRPRKQTEDA
ncbi:hypothetical protein RM863_11650 [Streptomyces sp. DSM 41014]|uniref:Uncharacterized protein n=1 Tax=Streptomyces hintoniae TaxID=3075521 RepID=A0ABU2UI49_9ACTN|nr:hypothetical protein [Streptomyces sp. DSM 41014]MDT0472780.1 hypothetical protein [Streptomyces sp. DSM 41014]